MPEAEAQTRARVTIHLAIETTLEVRDNGYLGTSASVDDHIKHAKEQAAKCKVLLQQVGDTPKSVPFKYAIQKVTIEETT